jgi:osmoprotectant transport system permease protein
MHFLQQLFDWFTTASHWQGASGIPSLFWATVKVPAVAILITLAITLPVALYLGHIGRGGFLAINVTSAGRALPAIAVLIVSFQWLGLGAGPAVAMLVVLSIPPIMTNTYTAIRHVDPQLVDAARGMGMTGWQILWRVEVPTSIPLMWAGLRTASVQAVATVNLAAFVAYTCFGSLIVEGVNTNDQVQVAAGTILAVSAALLTELVLAGLQPVVTPAGVRLAEHEYSGASV